MEKGINIIKKYLEDDLRLSISEDIEYGRYNETNSVSKTKLSIKWYEWLEKIIIYIILILHLLIWTGLCIAFAPFLIWVNTYPLYLRIRYKIPFTPILLPIGACKSIDLINNKIKIEIRPNDHLPPHFHVIIDEQNASFTILNGELLKGSLDNKYIKTIKRWYKKNRNTLICQWNLTRPSDKINTRIKTGVQLNHDKKTPIRK
jgi:hypothetical protein